MKRLFLIALALILSVSTVDVSAQSFMKKMTKKVQKEVENNVNKEVKKKSKKRKKTQSKEQKSQTKQISQTKHSQTKSKSSSNLNQEVKTIDTMVPYGPVTGQLNNHKWVDMGLPSGTRWATCNVDATAPEQPGRHYSWGETVTKKSYTEKNTKYYGKDIEDFSGNKAYDVATVKWGKGWRMPTKKEFDELVHYCNWKYVQKGGRWGAEITSPKTKNSIFLPATGSKDGTSLHEASGCGMYWTSTPYKSQKNNGAHDYHFGGALGEMGVSERYYGYAIRPVTDYDEKIEVPSSGEINGHKWVDLGLPSGLKWATCNLGTNAVDQSGDHYSWGETISYIDKDSKKNEMYGKQASDIAGNTRYDAARALWGGTWRLPTEEDFKELVANCTFEWTSIGRRSGMKVTSKTNGNYIFLPASGDFESSSDSYGHAHDINEVAAYWTSTPARNSYSYDAYAFRFRKTSLIILPYKRFYGYSIRPVSD